MVNQANMRATAAEQKLKQLEGQKSAASGKEVDDLKAKLKELTDRAKAAETKAAQQEARAAQAEARAKMGSGAAAGGDAKVRAAEAKVAELEKKVQALAGIEDEYRAMQGMEIQLKQRIQELEDREEPTSTNLVAMPANGASSAEFEKLKTENANLKKKLMSAETAIEAAASLKAKVAKLEAQLKGAAPRK
jgi:DNA repair exonuclease SbcCD ATPase subunit